MKKMHERHVKLMREMDENYRLIEQETQEYYIEFLSKWKEVAKSKITQYRKAIEQLAQEKEMMGRNKDQAIDTLNEKLTQLLKEKEKFMKEYVEDLRMRDLERDQLRLSFEDDIRKHEREKGELQKRVQEKNSQVHRMEQELHTLRSDYRQREEELLIENQKLKEENEKRINGYEDALNKKISEQKTSQDLVASLQQKVDKLEKEIQNMSLMGSSAGKSNSITAGLQGKLKITDFKKIQFNQPS